VRIGGRTAYALATRLGVAVVGRVDCGVLTVNAHDEARAAALWHRLADGRSQWD
jgi:hypothetical protein